MKLFYAALPSIVFSATDCNIVRQSLYPGVGSCDYEMKCSTNYACMVDEDTCNRYECLSEEMGCPTGTTYKPFLPSTGGEGLAGQGTTSSAGWYCAPDDTEQAEGFTCFFDPEDDFKLKINVVVPEINKFHDWDDREITLISAERFATQDKSPGVFYTVFNSMNALDENECVGQKADGNVNFENIVQDTRCDFTRGAEVDEAGVLWYVQSFVVGYDDLMDDGPNGPVFKRYGQNWNLECRIKASETLYVEPGAEGGRDENEIIVDINVDFNMAIYLDDEFTEELTGLVDIGVNSQQEQTVYVKAWGDIQNAGKYMTHLKSCEIRSYRENSAGDQVMLENPMLMMSDGCLVGYNDTFINRNFGKIKYNITEHPSYTRIF